MDFGNGTPTIGGQIRNSIARLDPTTGQADSWDPNANGRVNSIAVQADGKILAGGQFSAQFGTPTIGGATRNRIVRLDSTTGLADSFDPNANSEVRAITVQPDGRILAGGTFDFIGGQARSRIARLNAATGAADSFNPNSNSTVNSIAVQADGKILVGGFFTNLGGQPRNRIARLDPVTGAADSFDPNASNAVNAIAVQADGKILVGGFFNGTNSIGGTTTRNRIARLDPTTGTPDLFDPNANNDVLALAVQADGKILVGGGFNGANSIDGQTRNHIARLETDGRLDQTFPDSIGVPMSGYIRATALQPDGKILIGGRFIFAGVERNNIARFNTDGTPDTAFNPNANSDVNAIAVQADGKILLGGSFTTLSPPPGGAVVIRNRIARLFPDGTLDTSFNPNANGNVFSIAVQADGKILLGGSFTTLPPSVTRDRIARLFSDGTLDNSFNPTANGDVASIVVQADGKILVGGLFNGPINTSTIGGATRNYIARLEPLFGTADSFDPNADNIVDAIAVQPDGLILAGGSFTSIGAGTRSRMARLNATSGLADSFNPNANSTVISIAVQGDGKILAGGGFTTIGGQPRNRIARLGATNGLVDPSDPFDPNANNVVDSIALQSDGKILVGGLFNGNGITIGGQGRSFFARLSNDTAALQNLAATQSTITWTRGGSSTQFTRVTFESSTDNLNYTFLGNGTASGSNWSLTGLNFATGQSIYIRARGYYRSGYQNGSESITESVRNAFISPPPTPTLVVSRKTHGGAGTFDINLPLTGNPGIECRSGGASNNYQVVFTFPSAVTFTNAAVTAGAGSVSSSSGSGTTTVTVNLTGVTNAQRIMVTLQGASDGTNTGDLSVPMGVLLGDVNGNGSVNSTDISQTKLQSGQAVTNANFREDVNANGSINATDVSSVKLKSGTALP